MSKDNILKRIAASKHREVEAMKRIVPLNMLRIMAVDCPRRVNDMLRSILTHNPGIIAEHKRRSPSKGEIFAMSNVDDVARGYYEGGAAAMSVLTDTPFFGGSLEDLALARSASPELPLLRKDFMVDDYQVYQARLYGADAILLIAAMISREDLFRMNDLAHSLGLQTLVEIHSLEELESLPEDADMVGINNRDLTSFQTDIENSARLVSDLPAGMVKIAESGIRTPEDVIRLRKAGFDGFLIGEALMSGGNPGSELKRFVTEIDENLKMGL